MNNKRRLIEVLKYILDNHLIEGDEFICIAMSVALRELNDSSLEEHRLRTIFNKYKPTKRNRFKEFTEHPFFTGGYSWWELYDREERHLAIEERIKYVKKLIEVLEAEVNK